MRVDIYGPSKDQSCQGPALIVHNPDQATSKIYPMPKPIGTVVPVFGKSEALVALKDGVHCLDLQSGTLTHLCNPDPLPNNRLNDGKCSPEGRFWVGSMSESNENQAGGLFVVERDRKTFRKVLDGVSISNGIAWTSDAKTMFYIDTPTREVAAFDYD